MRATQNTEPYPGDSTLHSGMKRGSPAEKAGLSQLFPTISVIWGKKNQVRHLWERLHQVIALTYKFSLPQSFEANTSYPKKKSLLWVILKAWLIIVGTDTLDPFQNLSTWSQVAPGHETISKQCTLGMGKPAGHHQGAPVLPCFPLFQAWTPTDFKAGFKNGLKQRPYIDFKGRATQRLSWERGQRWEFCSS